MRTYSTLDSYKGESTSSLSGSSISVVTDEIPWHSLLNTDSNSGLHSIAVSFSK